MPGDVGFVVSSEERRDSAGVDSVGAWLLELLPLWSWCSIAGRRREKCDARSAAGLVTGLWACDTGLRGMLAVAGMGGTSSFKGILDLLSVRAVGVCAAYSSSGSVTSATEWRLNGCASKLVRLPLARFELCVWTSAGPMTVVVFSNAGAG